METKSQKLKDSRSLRNSQESVKSAQVIQNKELIKSLFSGSGRMLQITYPQNYKKEKEDLSKRFLALNLFPLQLQDLTQQTKEKSSQSFSLLSNNYQLVEFIIKNFSFTQIDPYIESLIKLSSELVIIYILEHYELEIVNKKIEAITNEEVKYFVVRKILKIIRRIKKEQNLIEKDIIKSTSLENNQQFRVWGNQFRTYQRKKNHQNIQHKSSLQRLTTQTLSQPILLFYLASLTKYKPQKRVYTQLKENIAEYEPFLHQVLEIMRRSQLNSCIGLIYQKMNKPNQAFNFYQLVYNERMDVNVKKLAYVQFCHGRFLKRIYIQMLDICQAINSNTQWMRLLQAVLQPLKKNNRYSKQPVIELIQRVYSRNQNHPFIQQFGSVIQSTLLQVSSHIPVEQISQVFIRYSQLMNKTFMLNCLKSTMHTYSKSIFIYETSKEMVINDQASEFERIYNENKIRGVSCLAICENCEELIESKDKMLLYKCAHMYHKRCVLPDEEKCRKCVLVQVGERTNYEKSGWDLQELKNKKKEQSSSLSLRVIDGMDSDENKEGEDNNDKENEEKQNMKSNTIYRCLAFDQYLQRDEMKFDQFRKDFDTYLSKYQ